MTQKGNAGSSVAVPSAYTACAVCNHVWLAACQGRKAVVIPLKERSGGRTGESHPLSSPRADTRSRVGHMKLKMHQGG